jgi:cation diffusion facilitator CzcD-associated flavoprotein CzcO
MLCVAVLLQRGELDVMVLEAAADISGVWSKQYASLTITTRRAHCGLPHYPVPLSYAIDTAQRTGHSNPAHNTDGKLFILKFTVIHIT